MKKDFIELGVQGAVKKASKFGVVCIVEGTYDKLIYQLLCEQNGYKKKLTFLKPSDVIRNYKIQVFSECGTRNCDDNSKKSIKDIDNCNGVLYALKNLEKTGYDMSQFIGVIDRDYNRKYECLKCHEQLYITDYYALENIIVYSEVFLKEFDFADVKNFNVSHNDIIYNRNVPSLGSNFLTGGKGSGYFCNNYMKELLEEIEVKKETSSEEAGKLILKSWRIKKGGLSSKVYNTLSKKKSSGGLDKKIYENFDDLFPNKICMSNLFVNGENFLNQVR